MLVVFSVSLFLVNSIRAQLEVGEPCTTNNLPGKCEIIDQCPYAKNLLSKNQIPQLCSFTRNLPIVCCLDQKNRFTQNQRLPGNISTQYCDFHHAGVSIAAVGGTKALPRDYIHMALIGYGDVNNPEWRCGGSLISDEYILTAAHCARTRDLGPASVVRLGELNLENNEDDADPHNYPVLKIILHPEYKPPIRYNDIALMQIPKIDKFTLYIKPACLAVTDPKEWQNPIATGWGKTGFTANFSNHLIQVDLKVVDVEQCKNFYKDISIRHLPNGLSRERQSCAGDKGKDTCQGDSGGPLQYGQTGRDKYYTIFGITSFGKPCGITDSPGVYTRVPFYIEWLESIVWPNGADFLPPGYKNDD